MIWCSRSYIGALVRALTSQRILAVAKHILLYNVPLMGLFGTAMVTRGIFFHGKRVGSYPSLPTISGTRGCNRLGSMPTNKRTYPQSRMTVTGALRLALWSCVFMVSNRGLYYGRRLRLNCVVYRTLWCVDEVFSLLSVNDKRQFGRRQWRTTTDLTLKLNDTGL